MNNPYRRLGVTSILIIAFFAAGAPSGASSGAQKRLITETDLFKFAWIADPQISPDGSRVAFVRVWVNQKADRYDSALWMAPTNGGAARQLTAGPRDTSPRWSPDGKMLAFVRSTEKEGRPQPAQIYMLTLRGRRGAGVDRTSARRRRATMVAGRQDHRIHEFGGFEQKR